MHLFHTQCSNQNRNVRISALNEELVDREQVHSGICEIGLLVCIKPQQHSTKRDTCAQI